MDKSAEITPRGALLVTGASGKTGREFYRILQSRGYDGADEIVFVTRRASRLSFIKDRPVEELDINGLDQLRQLMRRRRVTEILHIAGIGSSDIVIEAAVRAGVKRAILVHTTGVYSRHKRAGELYRRVEERIGRLTAGRDICVTILRPTMIFGPGDSNMSVFVKLARRLRIFPLISGGRATLQPAWYRDLGLAYYQVLTHRGPLADEYILSGAAPMTFKEMIEEICRQTARRPRFVSLPYPIAIASAWALYLLTLGRKDYREKVQRLAEDRAFPDDGAARDFGYSPTPFPAALSEYLAKNRDF